MRIPNTTVHFVEVSAPLWPIRKCYSNKCLRRPANLLSLYCSSRSSNCSYSYFVQRWREPKFFFDALRTVRQRTPRDGQVSTFVLVFFIQCHDGFLRCLEKFSLFATPCIPLKYILCYLRKCEIDSTLLFCGFQEMTNPIIRQYVAHPVQLFCFQYNNRFGLSLWPNVLPDHNLFAM